MATIPACCSIRTSPTNTRPYHTNAIHSPIRDATYVLDGLLYHESELRIEEHYTDTAGFTDHVFALCPLIGFRFAPRIRDLADKRLYVPGKTNQWPALESMIGRSLNVKLIEQPSMRSGDWRPPSNRAPSPRR